MRSLLVIFLCLSRYFLFVPAFQLRRSDLLHQNSNSRYFPLYFHPNKPSPCLRTAVSVIPTDNDSEKDEIIWLKPVLEDPKRSWCFSILMATCGAMLGPFLDAWVIVPTHQTPLSFEATYFTKLVNPFRFKRYHSAFGVLEYNHPIKKVLWGSEKFAALTTAWWVPDLFALAGNHLMIALGIASLELTTAFCSCCSFFDWVALHPSW